MKTVHDYESLWRLFAPTTHVQLEAFRGVSVVRWHGQIERALMDFIDKYESARNTEYVDKLRDFLDKWRRNRLTGSINIETVEKLLDVAETRGIDKWELSRFFMGVAEGLRSMIAAQEELPVEPPPAAPRAAASRAPKSMPAEFGPEKSATPPATPDETPAEAAEVSGIEGAVDDEISKALK